MKTKPKKAQSQGQNEGEGRAVSRKFALKHILVPLDFSERSMQALDYAVPLARQHGATITLIHVVHLTPVATPPMMESELSEPPEVVRAMVDDARKALRQIAAKELPPDLAAEPVLRIGTPWDQIVRAAQGLPADLVVITTHGYTGLKHMFIGSTAERVVRAARCPVLTVRQREGGPKSRRRGGSR